MMFFDKLFNNKKRYELVYDYKLNKMRWSGHPRYMLFKRVGKWYFPLVVRDTDNVYGVDVYVDKMEATSIKLISLYFSRGIFVKEAFTREMPSWYFIAKFNDRLAVEYFDSYEDFVSKKAEYLI